MGFRRGATLGMNVVSHTLEQEQHRERIGFASIRHPRERAFSRGAWTRGVPSRGASRAVRLDLGNRDTARRGLGDRHAATVEQDAVRTRTAHRRRAGGGSFSGRLADETQPSVDRVEDQRQHADAEGFPHERECSARRPVCQGDRTVDAIGWQAAGASWIQTRTCVSANA